MVTEEKKWKMITCTCCGDKYGSYLHCCPRCRTPNDSEGYNKYWEKEK